VQPRGLINILLGDIFSVQLLTLHAQAQLANFSADLFKLVRGNANLQRCAGSVLPAIHFRVHQKSAHVFR